jgi:hypothetical protein
MFHYYTNMISQTSRAAAAGIFSVGLLLIGFGFLIYLLPKFFATLAAIVFVVAGSACSAAALKILLAQRKLDKFASDDLDAYRKNVHIHIEDHYNI